MPSEAEVLEYVMEHAEFEIRKIAWYLPPEHKEEALQESLLRVVKALPRLDPSAGSWKAFMALQVTGAVKDYLRSGAGYRESAWVGPTDDAESSYGATESSNGDDAQSETDGPESDENAQGDDSSPACAPNPTRHRRFHQRLKHRISAASSDGDALDVEAIAAIFGIHSETEDPERPALNPDWDLLARLARMDKDVHLVALLLAGWNQTQLAPCFGCTRERLSQRVRLLGRRLDAPEYYADPFIKQVIFALGLSEHFGMDTVDSGFGWDLAPLDLKSLNFKYRRGPDRTWIFKEHKSAESEKSTAATQESPSSRSAPGRQHEITAHTRKPRRKQMSDESKTLTEQKATAAPKPRKRAQTRRSARTKASARALAGGDTRRKETATDALGTKRAKATAGGPKARRTRTAPAAHPSAALAPQTYALELQVLGKGKFRISADDFRVHAAAVMAIVHPDWFTPAFKTA
jgi:hypothetical protein